MADIFLSVGESLQSSPFSNSRYFGNTGTESVGLSSGVTAVTLAQTVEKVTFTADVGTYLFQQQGNQLVVFNGAVAVARVTVQGDADGTQLQFGSTLTAVKVSAQGMRLGSGLVPSGAAAKVALDGSTDPVTPVTPTTPALPAPSGGPNASEQYMLELTNEARLDPLANAARYMTSYSPASSQDPAIQNALTFFQVGGSQLLAAYEALVTTGPLAWNEQLATAAQKHSAVLVETQSQTHQAPGELALGDRVKAEGYIYRKVGENVFSYAESILHGHAGFMVDWGNGPNGMQSPAGHRINIMSPDFTEIGIDITAEATPANPVGPLVVTQDLGSRGKVFVTGVAINDTDGNKFYSIGEGLGDLIVAIGSSAVRSFATGGYSLETTAGSKVILLSGAGLSGVVTVTATIGAENLKLDVVNGNTIVSSGSVSVEGAVTGLRGIGVKGLQLTAGAGNQTIEGTIGNDVLRGGDGNDTLKGGKGNDELHGGTGNNVIDGGEGQDIAVFALARSAYTITSLNGVATVSQGGSADTVTNVEVFRFADGDRAWNAVTGTLAASASLSAVEVNEDPFAPLSQSALPFDIQDYNFTSFG